jgi:hypothetical protein
MIIPVVIILVLVVGVGVAVVGCRTSRTAYESAPYQVVRTEGKFELRDYPALTVVETPMQSGGNGDGSFMRLFGFITGRNATKQKISMTTPVFMAGGGTNRTMAFVLPAKLPTGQVPPPIDPTLTVRELPAGRFGVLRFSGGRSARHEADSLRQLQAWLTAQNLSAPATNPVFGYFDPPWTPPFLRRNEVMLPIVSP